MKTYMTPEEHARLHRRRGRQALGLVIAVLVLIGVLTVLHAGVNAVAKLFDDTAQKQEYEDKLEGLCARWATEHITKEQMEEMEENVYLSKFHAQKGHLEQLAELDNRFHDILYEACDSKMLEHQLKDFHQYVLRVRKKTLASANRGPKSNEEHEQIMEAIKAGNADLAEQLAHQHMINAYDNMVKNGLNEAYAQQDKPQE
mgnify:CR=1 FL=1